MSKNQIILLLFLVLAFIAKAQVGVNAPGSYEFSAKDCFNEARYKGILFKDSLKANHVISGQRIWRVVSLDDQENQKLFNTNKGCTQVGLFEVIKFGLLDKNLNAFFSDDFNTAASSRLTDVQKINSMKVKDSNEVITFDENGEEKKEIIVKLRFYQGSDIRSFLIKEDWIFNASSGKTVKYIVAIAPLVINNKTGALQPLFWLYYPEWKELFNSFLTKSPFAEEPMSYADVFIQRKFISQISKENNVFDRSVRAVFKGEDIKQQADRIKEKMDNGQSDHFDH